MRHGARKLSDLDDAPAHEVECACFQNGGEPYSAVLVPLVRGTGEDDVGDSSSGAEYEDGQL